MQSNHAQTGGPMGWETANIVEVNHHVAACSFSVGKKRTDTVEKKRKENPPVASIIPDTVLFRYCCNGRTLRSTNKFRSATRYCYCTGGFPVLLHQLLTKRGVYIPGHVYVS